MKKLIHFTAWNDFGRSDREGGLMGWFNISITMEIFSLA